MAVGPACFLMLWAACASPFDGEDPLYDLVLTQKLIEGAAPASTVGGQLTTAEGVPHANRQVFCLNSLDGSAARTDARGKFEFMVAAGTYDCSVREAGGPEFPFVLAAYQDGSAGALGVDVVFNSSKPGPVPGGPIPPVTPAGMAAGEESSSAPLSPPRGLIHVGGHRAIFLFWNPVPGAASYRIYWNRLGAVDDRDRFIGGVSANYFLHRGLSRGAHYYYRVAAVGDGEAGELSEELAARTFRAREY